MFVKVAFDAFRELEKRLLYRWHDKERERSNRAKRLSEGEKRMVAARCLFNHDVTAWVGPPHDQVRAYVCLRCNAYASEPEIKDKGFEFESIPDWEIHAIFDEDLKRQANGNPRTFFMGGGPLVIPSREGPSKVHH